MRSFLKMLRNWRKRAVRNLVGLLWGHLTPQRKTAIWVHNYSHLRVQQPQRYFGKFTHCMTFGAHKLVPSEPFLDYRCELWQLLPAPYSARTFPLIFGLFAILVRNFAKIVAPLSHRYTNPVVPLKGQSLLKNSENSKMTPKPWHNTCSKYVIVERTARRTRNVTDR